MKRSAILVAACVAGAALTGFAAGAIWGRRGAHDDRRSDARANRKILYWHDPMHPAYRSDKPGIAPDCGMELEPVYEGDDASAAGAPGAVVVDPARQQLIGIRSAPVEESRAERTLRTLGRVAPDETRVHRLSAGVDGWIRRTHEDSTGAFVHKDDLLAEFYSADVIAPQQAWFYALDALDRVERSPDQKTHADQLRLVRDQLLRTKTTLESLGMGAVQLREIARTRQIAEDIELRAPVDGIVLARNVAAGQRFDRNVELYRIAELRRVWIVADVYEQDAALVHAGMSARFELPHSHGANRREAHVSAVPPQFDANARTYKVRLEADNADLALRPDMLVDVELPVERSAALGVPASAVLDGGLKSLVYVDRGNGHFEPRRVQTGWRWGDRVEIVSGLSPGERVVVEGNFLLDSESRMQSPDTPPEQMPDSPHEKAIDPSCGMQIDTAKAIASRDYKGARYFFCSKSCERKFEADPERCLQRR